MESAELRAAIQQMERQFSAIRAMPRPVPVPLRKLYGIEHIRNDGYVRLEGALCHVRDVRCYVEQKKWSWYRCELYRITTGTRTWLTWHQHEQQYVGAVSQSCLSLQDLGTTAEQVLALIAQGQGALTYDGQTYHYRDTTTTTCFSNDTPRGVSVPVTVLTTAHTEARLTIEAWGDEGSTRHDVYANSPIDTETIEIVVPGESVDTELEDDT